MKSDQDIKRDVEDELQWDPDIKSGDIAVAVKDGVVTLAGFVRSYSDKWQAETDAKRVKGVLAVANDIEVRLPVLGSDRTRTSPAISLPHSRMSCRRRSSKSRQLSTMGGSPWKVRWSGITSESEP